MTTETKELKAGRELDARIMADLFNREIEWWRGEPSYLGSEPGGWTTKSTVPRFSTDLFSAMKVLNAFKFGWRSAKYGNEKNFTVTLYLHRTDRLGTSASAETLPLAICLAALSALPEGQRE